MLLSAAEGDLERSGRVRLVQLYASNIYIFDLVAAAPAALAAMVQQLDQLMACPGVVKVRPRGLVIGGWA